MFFLRRKIQFICPACGIVSKLHREFVRQNEESLSSGPGRPPEVECHWCHEGLMVPLKYRFRNGEVFRLPHKELCALRARSKRKSF